MNKELLAKIVNNLESALSTLKKTGVHDRAIRSRYAEYMVALRLAQKGHEPKLLDERGTKSADIELCDTRRMVEVKSGEYRKDMGPSGATDASFGKGKQIAQAKFDNCVFVTFDEGIAREAFVFTLDELKEVAKPRSELAAHPETNPCLLMFFRDYDEYREYMKRRGSKELGIERDLIKHPREYNNAWDKIV